MQCMPVQLGVSQLGWLEMQQPPFGSGKFAGMEVGANSKWHRRHVAIAM